MRIAKMSVLEVQFMTPHLKSLGAVGVSRAEYHKLIENEVNLDVRLLPEHFESGRFFWKRAVILTKNVDNEDAA